MVILYVKTGYQSIVIFHHIIWNNRLDAVIYDHTLVSGLTERDSKKSEYYIALA